MIFLQLVKNNVDLFESKVSTIAYNLGVKPEWLMFCMWFESRFNPAIVNSIGATGLIQFMPETAISLGTTCEKLMLMSNIQQLHYVDLYFNQPMFKFKCFKDFVDLYCAIFWPAAVGKDDNYRMGGSKVAKCNPLFDVLKDGQITKGGVRIALLRQVPDKYKADLIS